MKKIIFLIFTVIVIAGCNSSVSPDISRDSNPDWYYPDTSSFRVPDSLLIRN